MRQPGARKVALPDTDDLRLRGQPAQRSGMQDPGAVAFEVAAFDRSLLGRLGDEPLAAVVVVRRNKHRRRP